MGADSLLRKLFRRPLPPPPPTEYTYTLSAPAWLVDATVDWADEALLLLLLLWVAWLLWHPSVPLVRVPLEEDEAADVLTTTPPASASSATVLACKDPATGQFLGTAKVFSDKEVVECVARARTAQQQWSETTFAQRRRLLRILSRCTLEHAEDICRISARDSGKTTTDAAFGEVLVTLEKLAWLVNEGEQWLRPETRSAGRMLFYKRARVEWHPRGVVGAIVPWNYPFHNILNPISAAVFAGNAIVIKVSEHAGWSARFYGRMIDVRGTRARTPVARSHHRDTLAP